VIVVPNLMVEQVFQTLSSQNPSALRGSDMENVGFVAGSCSGYRRHFDASVLAKSLMSVVKDLTSGPSQIVPRPTLLVILE
jgi:hypothetical protein